MRIQFLLWTTLAVATLGGVAAPVTEAGEIVLARDTSGEDAYSYGSEGGEYKVTSFTGYDAPLYTSGNALAGGVFQTFDLERNEPLVMGTTYEWSVSTYANQGGVGGYVPDYLSAETAYLFTEFWRGTLEDYDYTPGASGRAVTAGQLQDAIWYLEEEITSLDIDSLAWQWVLDARSRVQRGMTGLGSVRVLNLYEAVWDGTGGYPTYIRDVLILVPLPTAAWMGLPFLAVLAFVRRRQALRAG